MWRRSQTAGFTLVEMLVVILLVGLVITVLIPWVDGSRELSRQTTCAIKLKNVATAMHLYHDNFQRFPPSAFYRDGKNFGDKGISLAGVVPGYAGTNATDAKRSPYSIFVKLLPYYESGHIFGSINFKTDEAFAPANYQWASKVLPVQMCPSFHGRNFSTAIDYHPPTGIGRPALTNYKALGATTLACLQDSASATNIDLNGGIVHPYETYSFYTLKAPTQTAWLAETKEQKYSAWWDGTTAAMPGFHPGTGNLADDRAPMPPLGVPALNISSSGAQNAFITKGQFGGKEDMLWGPSSEHPGLVNHANGGSEVRAIANDIDPAVYRALISRRSDDNAVLGNLFK